MNARKIIAGLAVAGTLLTACGGGTATTTTSSNDNPSSVTEVPADYGKFLGSNSPEKREADTRNPVDNAAITCVIAGHIVTVVQDGEVKGVRSLANLSDEEPKKIDLDQQGGPAEYYCKKVV